MGLADEVLRKAERERRFLWLEAGTVLEVRDSGEVVVNVGGSALVVPTTVRVRVSDLVRVLRSQEGALACIGGSMLPPVEGTVSTVRAGISVDVIGNDGKEYKSLPFLTGNAPASGDLVALNWDGETAVVLGKLSPAAGTGDVAALPVAPPKPPAPKSGTMYFSALDSGSNRISNSSWWTNKVYFATGHRGAWFYGTKVRDSLKGATALPGCKIYLPVEHAEARNVEIGIHSYAKKPAGAPSMSASRPVSRTVSKSDWYDLPTDIAQHMINVAGGGVSTYGAGYRIMTGTQGNSQSGRVAINYRR